MARTTRLSPQQRAARTRAANKAKRLEAERIQQLELDAMAGPKGNYGIHGNLDHLGAVNEALASRNQLRTVTVEFAGNSCRYSYLTRDDDLKEGDYAIVMSPNAQRNYSGSTGSFFVAGGYPTIVKVISTRETVASITKANKWIIQRLDFDTAIAEEERRKELALLDARIEAETKRALQAIAARSVRGLSPELDRLIDLRERLG